MTTENLHKLLEKLLQTGGEHTCLEFKTNVAKQKSSVTFEGVGEYISALSNGATISNKDFAYLILGIEDDKQKLNKIKNILYSLSKKEGKIINNGSTRIAKWELI